MKVTVLRIQVYRIMILNCILKAGDKSTCIESETVDYC